jgi:hypothetical protein
VGRKCSSGAEGGKLIMDENYRQRNLAENSPIAKRKSPNQHINRQKGKNVHTLREWMDGEESAMMGGGSICY